MSDRATVKRLSDFGTLPDGTPVLRYELNNGRGLRAEVIALGGIVLRLFVPGRDGTSENVLLGASSVEQILGNKTQYLGALIGRVGNRTGNAKFSLDGKEYSLAANDGPHSLHGGKVGYDKRIWAIETVDAGADAAAIKLTLTDPAATEGYAGTVKVTVVYTLTADGAWKIDYTATTDAATPINLTQHAYFNLKDAGRSPILDHVATIHAAKYTPSDATLLPTGDLLPVAGTPFDYTTPKPIGQDFSKLTNTPRGVDHNFVVDGDAGTLRIAAEVNEPVSGRRMRVLSTEPGIQFYTGNFLDGTIAGQDGFAYQQHTGFCLETQHYPNSANVPQFPSTILRPGQTYRTTTVYQFDVK
jgi:aldose 1-epimerase